MKCIGIDFIRLDCECGMWIFSFGNNVEWIRYGGYFIVVPIYNTFKQLRAIYNAEVPQNNGMHPQSLQSIAWLHLTLTPFLLCVHASICHGSLASEPAAIIRIIISVHCNLSIY